MLIARFIHFEFPAKFSVPKDKDVPKFRERIPLLPVLIHQSNEMDALRCFAITIILIAPLVAAAPAEVPEVKEFHEAITNEDDPTGVINEEVSVEELNVTSDAVKDQPGNGDIHEIGNAENAEMNLAAVSFVIMILAAGVMILGALCLACSCKEVKERMARRKKKTVGDCGLVGISVVDDEADNSTQSPTPNEMDKSVNRSTVYQKIEYVPQEKSYFF